MELGLRTLTFQYLHLKVLVTQHLDVDEDDCVATAREALSLVPSLVSDSSGVYNAVVW
jgi:hypothetical protein